MGVSPARLLALESNADVDGALVLRVFGSNLLFPLPIVLVVFITVPPAFVIVDDVSCLEKECFLGGLFVALVI